MQCPHRPNGFLILNYGRQSNPALFVHRERQHRHAAPQRSGKFGHALVQEENAIPMFGMAQFGRVIQRIETLAMFAAISGHPLVELVPVPAHGEQNVPADGGRGVWLPNAVQRG
jgi:hypothetical protein